jgi:threonine/homoserine/homoserine lactone efflux protein
MPPLVSTSAWTIAVVMFAISTCFSPGPNNLMLVTSGAKFGLARSWRHVWGVALGFPLMVAIVAMFLGAVFQALPVLHDVLNILGAAYLLYLSWKIIMAGGSVEQGDAGKPLSFTEAALFQWVNPKAWVMATGAIAAYTTASAYAAEVAGIVAAFTAAGFASSLTWAGFGTLLARFLSTPGRMRAFNIVLGVLLIASVVPIYFSQAPPLL